MDGKLIPGFFQSFTGRLVLGALLIHVLLAALLFLGMLRVGAEGYESQFVSNVRNQAHLLSSLIGQQTKANIQQLLDDVALSGEIAYAEYLTDRGEIVTTMPVTDRKRIVFREDFFFGEHGDHIYFIASPVRDSAQRGLGTLRLGFDESPVEERIESSRKIATYLAVSYIALMFTLIGFSGGLLTRSIRQLQAISRKIATGHTEENISIKTSIVEISALAGDMELMRRELIAKANDISLREAHQRAILDTAAEGIITIDAACNIESFNKASETIFGYSAADVLHTPFRSLLDSFDGTKLLSANGVPIIHGIHEVVGIRKSGEEFPVRLAITETIVNDMRFFTILAQDISERRKFELQLSYQATYDALTGLPNRFLFMDRLSQMLAQNLRDERLVALLFIDLDRFKYVNDTLGHHVGDLLLLAVSNRLKTCVRSGDTLARLGGDEFTAVLPGLKHVDGASAVAQKILDALEQPFPVSGHELFVGCSIGITIYPLDDNNTNELLKNADTAMYTAKARGGKNYQFYTAHSKADVSNRMDMETQLRYALERNELLLHYQPQVCVASGRVVGVEALLRWNSPQRGLVPPDEFIHIAEETGLIVPIGEWVLRTACVQGRAWHDAGFRDLIVAVNLSVRQLVYSNLMSRVMQALADTGFDPNCLELELTEHVLMQHMSEAIETLRELASLGIKLSLDDFGTGYSSLSYLRQLPIKTLKIAQPFMLDVPGNPDHAVIASTIIAMGHGLGLTVIAEGVEQQEQMDFVRAHQCDVVQGYYFSRPLPPEAVVQLFKEPLGKSLAQPTDEV